MKIGFACATAVAALSAATANAATTSAAGGGQAFSNMGPGLVVSEVVSTQGLYPQRQSGVISTGGGAVANAIGQDDYLASIDMFAGNFAPLGSYAAQGATLPISQNTALYSLVGPYYGGNGTTNFQLPNLSGRSAVGTGTLNGYGTYVLGQQSGQSSVTLTTQNMPAHVHTATDNGQTVTTGVTGGGVAYDSSKPTLAITYLIQTQGLYPNSSGGAMDGMLGQIGAFAGTFVPVGYAAANGQLLSIAQNEALFSIIGTTYGGDGVTNFALPNLIGRSAVGVGQGVGMGQPITLGQAFGSNSTRLTEAQMPAHTHTLADGTVTAVEGGSQPIGNYGASLGLHYIIAVNGVYPTRNSASLLQSNLSIGGDTAQLGEISLWAGNTAPAGWMFADGQTLSISQNPALYSILGTMYGGDGKSTFQLPDFRGRTALGSGVSALDGANYTAGELVGAQTVTLTTANLPPHTHDYTPPAVVTGAVPEPASWAMMIAGFGLVGAASRRRTRVAAAA